MTTLTRIASWMMLAVLPASTALAAPLGTGFSYQGQLIQNGTPVNGTVVLRFSLWDASSSGSQIGASQILSTVSVTNGLFTVVLNDGSEFGPNAFNGSARWLQIEVCTESHCTFTAVLSPRQAILPTPYARFCGGPWQVNGSSAYYSGNVGIGTTTPGAQLSLGSNNANSKLLLWDDGSPTVMGLGIGPNQFRLHLGLPVNRFSFLDGPAGNELFTIQGNGNVGVGTANPAVKLDVMGAIYLGAGARYSVPGAEEDLKMVRGTIDASGTPTAGCCYAVSHPLTGSYDITFSTPFTAIPSVTATTRGIFTVASTVPISASSVRINVQLNRNGGGGADDNFDFIAIGPR